MPGSEIAFGMSSKSPPAFGFWDMSGCDAAFVVSPSSPQLVGPWLSTYVAVFMVSTKSPIVVGGRRGMSGFEAGFGVPPKLRPPAFLPCELSG